MAGFSAPAGRQPITGINVTPLVDITLVLLIIFMVTAKLVVSRAMPMDLPAAVTGAEVQEIFSVGLSADGTTRVNGVKLRDQRELIQRARSAAGRNRELRAVIRADGSVPHRRLMGVLDGLRQAGVGRVAFAVSPAPSPEDEGKPGE